MENFRKLLDTYFYEFECNIRRHRSTSRTQHVNDEKVENNFSRKKSFYFKSKLEGRFRYRDSCKPSLISTTSRINVRNAFPL